LAAQSDICEISHGQIIDQRSQDHDFGASGRDGVKLTADDNPTAAIDGNTADEPPDKYDREGHAGPVAQANRRDRRRVVD
jgi:hypothetical protein